MERRTVAVAGGSGFIGRAISRRLAQIPEFKVRVLSRNPNRAQLRLPGVDAEFVRAEITDPPILRDALRGCAAVVNAVQFDGYPIENPKQGLTFERVDYGGTVSLLAAAKDTGVGQFVYISGAAADENREHPGFRSKGLAERAIRESGLEYTILRPSLVYGPEDHTVNLFARMLKVAPVFPVPDTGKPRVEPVFVEDVAACVALALTAGEPAANQTFDVGGPDLMTFDELMHLLMEITGKRRPLLHIPESMLRAVGAIGERFSRPFFSRDAVDFVTADNATNIGPLVNRLGIKLTPAREALGYLNHPQAR